MDVPFLKESIVDSLTNLVNSTLVLPEHIEINYEGVYSDPTPVLDDFFVNNFEKHKTEVEKSVQSGEYAGLLNVRVFEAKQIKINRASAQPYCIITTGHEIFTTKPVQVKKKNHAVWNQLFEMLIKKEQKKVLEITVMARDELGDDLCGMAKIDFSDFGKETNDIWATLELTSKKGAKSQSISKIRVQIKYFQAQDTLQTIQSPLPERKGDNLDDPGSVKPLLASSI